MGGGPISPSSKLIPGAPLTLRRATIDDLDDITWICVNGSPDDPGTDYRFPYRDKYPEDFWKWTRIEHEELFERPDKLVILVVTAPVLDNGEVVHQPVSYGVWDLKVTSDFIPGEIIDSACREGPSMMIFGSSSLRPLLDGSIPGRHCFRDRTLQVPTYRELKKSRGSSMRLKWLNQVLCIASCLAVVISRGFLAWLSVED
uniref:N-acetyltransferase domain-containing protein n=1 Tax=Fusarium oxysporum (strain Fo5176) TaxID=660025 RepID=A0A0D2XXH6_FUSOF